jgi:hypothetical protein
LPVIFSRLSTGMVGYSLGTETRRLATEADELKSRHVR